MARRLGPFTCSFCGKRREQTRRLIAGPNRVYICAECVSLCNEILAEGELEAVQQTGEVTCDTPHPRRPAWRRLLDGWLQGLWHLTPSHA